MKMTTRRRAVGVAQSVHQRRRRGFAALMSLLLLAVVLPVALTAPGAAAQSPCTTAPVFDDQLNAPWYPASWSGTTTTVVDGALQVSLPNDWSALSFATPPLSVTGCTELTFTIQSNGGVAPLRLTLNDQNSTAAGAQMIEVTPSATAVSIDMASFNLPSDLVTRFSLQNQSNPGFGFTIDDIAFGPVEMGPHPTPTPDPPGPIGPSEGPCRQVFADSVEEPWLSSPWSIQDLSLTETITALFPRRWGAISFRSSEHVAIEGHTHVSFTMQASVADSEFVLRLNTENYAVAGDVSFTVGTSPSTVRIPLDLYDITNSQLQRLSIINRADANGTTVAIDNIRLDTEANESPICDPIVIEPVGPIDFDAGSGVNLPSGEYVCVHNLQEDGYRPTDFFDHRLQGVSDQELAGYLSDWGVQTVRLPLNSHCWVGGFDYIYPELQGQPYRDAIIELVDALQAEGIVSFLELAWSNSADREADFTGAGSPVMPDTEIAPQFWAQVSSQFASYGDDVFYGPYNEPHPDRIFGSDTQAWDCWRDGCQGPDGSSYGGMQLMVDAIRSSGSDQAIAFGGLDFSYDFSRWLEYLPTDPAVRLVADSHIYDFKGCVGLSCYASDLLAIQEAGYPVIIGELGQGVVDGTSVCGSDFVSPIMDWADQNGIPYLGWRYSAAQGTNGCRSFGPNLGNGIMALVETWDGSQRTPMGEALWLRLQAQN